MSILKVNDLSHSFGEKELYQNISFELFRGEHMGVVGQNGTGKSTLIKLLLGEILPFNGDIHWQKNLSIGCIDQHQALSGDESITSYLHSAFAPLYALEQKMLAIYEQVAQSADMKLAEQAAKYQERLIAEDFYQVDVQVQRVAEGLGLSALGMDRPIQTLSGGQATKLILARLLLQQPDILLLDEPTNYLDTQHILWLTDYLKGFPGSFIIVSHDFQFLDGVSNCILDIEFQQVQKYNGSYRDFLRQKKQRREDYIRRFTAQQRQISKLETYIAKNRVRTATARQAQSRIKQLDKIDRLTPPDTPPTPHIAFSSVPLGTQRILAVENLLVGYDKPLLPPISFTLEGGETMAITGFNGIGKSTLLKTLVGAIPQLGGDFSFIPQVKLGYFEQPLHFDHPSMTPIQFISALYPALSRKQVYGALAKCGLTAKQAMQAISSLSGGEQNKLKLCRLCLEPCNLLILDEPTNHLDKETKRSLAEAIDAFPGSVLLVSHEQEFWEPVADLVLDIEKMLG